MISGVTWAGEIRCLTVMLRNIYGSLGTVIGINRLFLDTAPLIYFLDDDENYADKMRDIFYELLTNDKQLCRFREIRCETVEQFATWLCQ